MSLHSLDPTLPNLLAEALQLSRQANGSSPADPDLRSRRQERFRQLQTKLSQYGHTLQQDPVPLDAIPSRVRYHFVRALLMMNRKLQLGGLNWRGSLLSPTLARYRPDPFFLSPQERTLEILSRGFELTEGEQQSLHQQLADIDQRIAQQKQIMAAVLATVDQPLPLFHLLFGPIPVPAEALTWIYTETQIYFCLDYHNTYLRRSDLWQELSPAERAQLTHFLSRLRNSDFERFHRFPIFGPCQITQIDSNWCQQLAQTTGFSQDTIIQALCCSVRLIPTEKAEAFLIHDIWGHYWQWMLTQFESDYSVLATCDHPLRSMETAYTPQGPLSCQDLFTRTGDQIQIDPERARLFFRGEVQQRLGFLFTHLLGEMVADMAEFKFIADHPHAVEDLPSSSLFKTHATKLDLSLGDLDYLFLRILRPLLEFHVSALTESPLEQELLCHWLGSGETSSLTLRIQLKRALTQLAQIFLEEYERTYLPQIQGQASLYTRLVTNLLYLQNVINSLSTGDYCQPDSPPFRDLLQVFIGCYCSTDSYAEFWEIDDILAAYFLPCWHRFRVLLDHSPALREQSVY